MVSGSVIVGSGVNGVMVWGPAPAMLNWIKSGTLVLRLAVSSACRNEPGPLSLMFVTVMTAAAADNAMPKKQVSIALNGFIIVCDSGRSRCHDYCLTPQLAFHKQDPGTFQPGNAK